MASKLGSQGGARHDCKISQNVAARPMLVPLFVLGMHGLPRFSARLGTAERRYQAHRGDAKKERSNLGRDITVGALGSDAVMWRYAWRAARGF